MEPVENLCEFDDQEMAVCTPPEPPADDPADSVTAGDILEAAKRVRLPRLNTVIQPPGTTLVNLDTNFYTRAEPFERTVEILDSTVIIRAEPIRFTWHHGDDTTQTTHTSGRPYPDLDITHPYRQPGTVRARVDVTYAVTYRIDDDEWQDLDQTLSVSGPTTVLRIREARPELTE